MNRFKNFWHENQKEIITRISIAAVIYIFSTPIKTFFYKNISPLFNELPNTDILRTFIFIVLGLSALIFICKNCINKKYPSGISLITFSLFFITYICVFRKDEQFNFILLFPSFKLLNILDILFFFLLTFLSNYVYKGQELELGEISLIEDDFSGNIEDLYLRKEYANEITKIINATTSKRSISIAVLAEWGYGKTVFLNFVRQELEKGENNIILDFSPWKTEEVTKSLHLFYEELENRVAEYDKNLGNQFKDYFTKIIEPKDDDSKIFHALKITTNRIFFSPKSLNDRVKGINKSLKRIGKRIIIFSDDWDRLSGDELMYLIRLIRDTSDFANTIFISAFDKNYVLKSLGENRVVHNTENFLSKIFQLEIQLPPIIKERIIENSFKTYFEYEKLPINDKIEIDKVLEELNPYRKTWLFDSTEERGVLEDILQNRRDVLRFVNSFKIAFRLTYREALFREFFLLELIKYKFSNFYNLLANRLFIKKSHQNGRWYIDKSYFNSENKILEINDENKIILKKLMDLLFEKGKKESYDITPNKLPERSIQYPRNHALYFNYILFGLISYKEFNEIREKGYEDMKKFVDHIVEDKGKIENLIKIIEEVKIDASKEEFEMYFMTIMYIIKQKQWTSFIHYIAPFLSEDAISKYPNNDKNAFKRFVEKKILLNADYPTEIRSEIAYSILYEFLYDRKSLLFTKAQIKSISLKIFEEILSLSYVLPKERFFLYNIDYIDEKTKKVIIEKEAIRMYKEYIYKNSQEYFRNVIRPYSYPEHIHNDYVFDPFINQIFDDIKYFEELLNKQEDNNCMKFVKEKYLEFKSNNYQPIIIKDFATINPCKNFDK